MSFDNYFYKDSNQQQQPSQPGQPQFVYVDPLMSPQNLSEQAAQHYHMVRMRSMNAQCRVMELNVILDSLREIRTALCVAAIGEKDSGGTERPPLEKAFDEVNCIKLQEAYLYLTERMANYTDAMMKQLAIPTTNEIKKQ